MADFDALQKQRMEKDLSELQALIATHFEKRKKDDEELKSLEDRIETRKAERAEQIRVRQEREQARAEREKEERKAKEEEEERKKVEEEQRRKAAMQSMAGAGGSNKRERGGNRRQTEREKKRKALAERRKPLNIDHLTKEKLLEKVKELAKHAAMMEESKYDYEQQLDRQKYDIFQNRGRVSDYQSKLGKGGMKGGKRAVKTLANVSARAGAFK